MKRALLAAPVVFALVALLWFGFGKDPSNINNPLVGKEAPNFRLRATDGRLVSLTALRGRPVVLNFFASWCIACMDEEANVVSTYRAWRTKVTFLSVIYQDYPGPAAEFTRSHGGKWMDLIDPGSATAINYGLTGVPGTYFINPLGRIVYYTASLRTAALTHGVEVALRT